MTLHCGCDTSPFRVDDYSRLLPALLARVHAYLPIYLPETESWDMGCLGKISGCMESTIWVLTNGHTQATNRIMSVLEEGGLV